MQNDIHLLNYEDKKPCDPGRENPNDPMPPDRKPGELPPVKEPPVNPPIGPDVPDVNDPGKKPFPDHPKEYL